MRSDWYEDSKFPKTSVCVNTLPPIVSDTSFSAFSAFPTMV